MKKKSIVRTGRRFGLLLGLAVAAHLSAAHADMIEGRTNDGHRYVAGGIGLEESEAMRQQASSFPLALVTAARSGAYLANTHVRILGAGNATILDTVIDAPWLLVDLPSGNYTILTTHAGKTIERRVNVSAGKPQRVVITYDVPVDNGSSNAAAASSGEVARSQPPQ